MHCFCFGPRPDPCTAGMHTRSKTFSIYALAVNLCCFSRRAATTMFYKGNEVEIREYGKVDHFNTLLPYWEENTAATLTNCT